MSWGDIDLSSLSTDVKPLAENTKFIFELIPVARFGKFDEGRVDAGARVVEGPDKGTVVYFSYPNPTLQAWVPGVFARMIGALRTPNADGAYTEPLRAEAGEDPVTFLNRAAKAGARFVGTVKQTNVQKDGLDVIKVDLKIGGVSPIK